MNKFANMNCNIANPMSWRWRCFTAMFLKPNLCAIGLIFAVVGGSNLNAQEQLWVPEKDTAYKIIEPTKREFVTRAKDLSVRRWSKLADTDPGCQNWVFQNGGKDSASVQQYIITSADQSRSHIYVNPITGILEAGSELKFEPTWQFKIWKLSEADAKKYSPNIVNEKNVVYVLIEETTEANNLVSVGGDGVMRRWVKKDWGKGDPEPTQVFAIKKIGPYSVATDVKKDEKKVTVKTYLPSVAAAELNNDHRASQIWSEELGSAEGAGSVDLDAVETQIPSAQLAFPISIRKAFGKKVVQIGVNGTTLSASKTGGLAFDEKNNKGYYLESVSVEISCLTAGFDLKKHAPLATNKTGAISMASGWNLGGSVGTDSAAGTGSYGESKTLTATYNDFTVNAAPADNIAKSSYTMTQCYGLLPDQKPSNVGVPYNHAWDLVDNQWGAFSGCPLRIPPLWAKSSLPLISAAEFLSPNDFSGVATFNVKITMHLVKTSSSYWFGSGGRIAAGAVRADRVIDRTFTLNLNPTETYVPKK